MQDLILLFGIIGMSVAGGMSIGRWWGRREQRDGGRVSVQMPAPMPAEELARVLGQVRDDTPLWRAMHQLLAEDIAAAMNTAADKRAANRPGDMAHAAGGLSWLLDFRDRICLEAARAQRVEGKGED